MISARMQYFAHLLPLLCTIVEVGTGAEYGYLDFGAVDIYKLASDSYQEIGLSEERSVKL